MFISLFSYVKDVLHERAGLVYVDGKKTDFEDLSCGVKDLVMSRWIYEKNRDVISMLEEDEKFLFDNFIVGPSNDNYHAMFEPIWKRHGNECREAYNDCVDKIFPVHGDDRKYSNVITRVNFGG